MKKAEYLGDLERFFAVVRMGGFVLSQQDLAQAERWYQSGLPLSVVVKAISNGVQQWRQQNPQGHRPPHNLRFYAKLIRTRINVFRKDEEEVWSSLSRPRQFVANRIAEARLLANAEARPVERDVKEHLLTRLCALEQDLAATPIPEGEAAYRLLLLDGELLRLYHLRLTGREEQLSPEEEDRLRETLRVPNLRYWSS